MQKKLNANKVGILNLTHTTELSKTIFEPNEDAVMSVWDGTYIFIQKSSNYFFQKESFSMHKHRNLLKIMIIISTTGHIIECFGPYFAKGNNNHAKISQDTLKDKTRINGFFKDQDIFIVDRGFRDILEF